MAKKNSPGCNCCCKDTCMNGPGIDQFEDVNPRDYENDNSHFSIVQLNFSGHVLQLPCDQSGKMWRTIGSLGSMVGRRWIVSAICYPFAPTGDLTQKNGIFWGDNLRLYIKNIFVGGELSAQPRIIKYLDGVETDIGHITGSSAALKIEVNDDGYSSGQYTVNLWSGGSIADSFQFTPTDAATEMGIYAASGGQWDNLCMVYNHNLHCFGCMLCSVLPISDFPKKWQLSFPDKEDGSEEYCNSCDLLRGDHELIFFPQMVRDLTGDVGCAWATVARGNPCPNASAFVGNLWQLSSRGNSAEPFELIATNGSQMLVYGVRSPNEWHCDSAVTMTFVCTVCTHFTDHGYVDSCNHPDEVVLIPIFDE